MSAKLVISTHQKETSFIYIKKIELSQGGAVTSWLVSSTPDQAVRVRALEGDIVLSSWAKHSTPRCINGYRWYM